jgi:curved DNA-binding protein CbpA
VTRREDPHRVLGLARDAPMAEVKRAYRLLAKRHHPDAGDGSVERFLEVLAAYEVLARGEVAGTSRSGSARTPGRRSAQPGSRAAGAGRAGSERSDEGGAPPPPGSGWAGRPAGAARHAGSGQAGDRWRGRDPQKATLGSTTYDGAGATAEPTWDGADWYGRASGTYWTMNPREYADPRKHGPEYTARWAGRNGIGAPEPAPRSSRGPIPGARASASLDGDSRSRVPPAPRSTTEVRQPAWARFLERLVALRGRLTGRPWRARP